MEFFFEATGNFFLLTTKWQKANNPKKVQFVGLWAREDLIWGPTNPGKTTTAERLEARIRIVRETGMTDDELGLLRKQIGCFRASFGRQVRSEAKKEEPWPYFKHLQFLRTSPIELRPSDTGVAGTTVSSRDRRTKIQELRGNIRVFCRVRPRTPNELGKPMCSMNFSDECTVEIGKSDGLTRQTCSGKLRGARQEFSFDKMFPPTAR